VQVGAGGDASVESVVMPGPPGQQSESDRAGARRLSPDTHLAHLFASLPKQPAQLYTNSASTATSLSRLDPSSADGELSPRQMTSPAPAPDSSAICSSAHRAIKDPRNDVVIRSSDGKLFPFRRLWLEVASPVFESMFKVGRGNDAGAQPSHGQLPVVDVSEDGALVEMFLVYAHPQEDGPPAQSVEELDQCVTSARAVCRAQR
jgi:hypothetical protein